jgi:hypothetical protein
MTEKTANTLPAGGLAGAARVIVINAQCFSFWSHVTKKAASLLFLKLLSVPT